jgi:hypothetical protein
MKSTNRAWRGVETIAESWLVKETGERGTGITTHVKMA